MNWAAVVVVIAVIAAWIMIRRAGQISQNTARAYLQQGALVIDVRTNAEFQAGHLGSAIHIPVDEIETLAPRRLKDKDQVLLLHCASGTRSAMAKRKLAAAGYTRAFNLGSYSRAARIVGGHRA
jgi:phage shock protein E